MTIEAEAPPLSPEEIAHTLEHLAAGCSRHACMLSSSGNCYDRLMVTHRYARTEPPSPEDFIKEFFGPRLLATIAAKDREIAQINQRACICTDKVPCAHHYREFIAPLESKLREAELPIPMILYCPNCRLRHIDRGEWATPTKAHRTHLCENCGSEFRPSNHATVGVVALQDAKEQEDRE